MTTDYPFTTWFRRALRRYLQEHRINRNEVARKLDMTPASIHRWDRGLSFPKVEQQAKLAELFGEPEDAIARLVRESEKRRQREADHLNDRRSDLPRSDARRKTKRTSRKSWLGSLAHTGQIVGDIVAPAIDAGEWEMLRPGPP